MDKASFEGRIIVPTIANIETKVRVIMTAGRALIFPAEWSFSVVNVGSGLLVGKRLEFKPLRLRGIERGIFKRSKDGDDEIVELARF